MKYGNKTGQPVEAIHTIFSKFLLSSLFTNAALDLNTLEKISLGGIAGTASGYVIHIEVGVNNTFFPVPAVFSFEFSPDEFGGLAGQLGFFDSYIVEFNRKAMSVVLKWLPNNSPFLRRKHLIVRSTSCSQAEVHVELL